MSGYLLTRALPFVLTLLVGAGLGSIPGLRKSMPTTGDVSAFESGRRFHRCSRRTEFSDSTPVRILSQPEKQYTTEALKNRTTGVVKLLVRFDADSTTTVLRRLSTLPDGLTEEAERIAKGTQFIPAQLGGQPVTETKEMNYIFTLSDSEVTVP